MFKFIPRFRPVSKKEFPSLYQEPRKRRVYEQAVVSLESKPVCPEDAEVKGFVKYEKTNFTKKRDPAPRLIQPRDPRYNVEVGVFLKPIEHALYHAIDESFREAGANSPVVAKGHNFATRAKVLHKKFTRFSRPRALLFDAKRFDQHVSRWALQFEHEWYLQGYRGDPRLAMLLAWQLTTTFTGRCEDGVVKFFKHGGRCSGDMNTALGNVIIMCAMFFAFMTELDIDYEFYDDGDDSVLIVEEENLQVVLDNYEEFFLQHGFTMTLGRVATCLEEIEFCQTHPVFDGTRWTMIRNPLEALAKDCNSTLPHPTKAVTEGWMAAVSECGEAISGGIPVWNSFYQCMRRAAHGRAALKLPDLDSGMVWNSRGMRRRFASVSDASRVSFWRAFGIQPARQILLERYYDECEWEVSAPEDILAHPTEGEYLRHCLSVLDDVYLGH